MIEPSIDELLYQVDSKYELVIVAAKRARQLKEQPAVNVNSEGKKIIIKKPVTSALQEIAAGKVSFIRPAAWIK